MFKLLDFCAIVSVLVSEKIICLPKLNRHKKSIKRQKKAPGKVGAILPYLHACR